MSADRPNARPTPTPTSVHQAGPAGASLLSGVGGAHTEPPRTARLEVKPPYEAWGASGITLEGVVVGVGNEQIWIRSDQGHRVSCATDRVAGSKLGVGKRVSLQLDPRGVLRVARRVDGGRA